MVRQAVILAGGKGTRLMPLTKDIPKPMVSVKGRPFLHWQLSYLYREGIHEVVLLISHLGHVIEEYFKANPVPGLDLHFAAEPEPMGTGGALRLALPKLKERFFLLNGDSFLRVDLKHMHREFERHAWKASIAVLNDTSLVPVPGNLCLYGDEVTAYRKGAGAAAGFPSVDAGVYLLSREVVEAGPGGSFDLESYWPSLIAKRQLGSYAVHERFYDIGTPERLKTFEEHVDDYF